MILINYFFKGIYFTYLIIINTIKTYTIISLTFFSAFVLVVIGKAAIKRYRQNSRMFFHSLIKKLILLTGFAGFFILIFAYQRFFAFLSLILALILYGFVAFGLSEK